MVDLQLTFLGSPDGCVFVTNGVTSPYHIIKVARELANWTGKQIPMVLKDTDGNEITQTLTDVIIDQENSAE